LLLFFKKEDFFFEKKAKNFCSFGSRLWRAGVAGFLVGCDSAGMRFFSVFCLIALAGCHLVDERDFDANAEKPPKLPAPPASPPGPGALLTLNYADGDPDYATKLAQSVQRALSVKPGVLFTVQTLVPPAATPDAQAAALIAAAGTGREIAEAIAADGADSGQIELAVRADPSVHAKEVRVFVH